MDKIIEIPDTSSNPILQDRFNQLVAELLREISAEIQSLKERVTELEGA